MCGFSRPLYKMMKPCIIMSSLVWYCFCLEIPRGNRIDQKLSCESHVINLEGARTRQCINYDCILYMYSEHHKRSPSNNRGSQTMPCSRRRQACLFLWAAIIPQLHTYKSHFLVAKEAIKQFKTCYRCCCCHFVAVATIWDFPTVFDGNTLKLCHSFPFVYPHHTKMWKYILLLRQI